MSTFTHKLIGTGSLNGQALMLFERDDGSILLSSEDRSWVMTPEELDAIGFEPLPASTDKGGAETKGNHPLAQENLGVEGGDGPNANRHAATDWVMVPKEPTDLLVDIAESYSDFVLPEGFENTQAERRQEMRYAIQAAMNVAPKPSEPIMGYSIELDHVPLIADANARAEAAEAREAKLREALTDLVRRDGAKEYKYLDRGIGTSSPKGLRWLAARAALATPGEKS